MTTQDSRKSAQSAGKNYLGGQMGENTRQNCTRQNKKKNPGRQQPCWGFLFCTNLTQPTGALDHKATEQLIFLLKKLNKEGKTIVVVTHDMEMARSGTKQFYMEDGKIFPL